jgi:murein DD-endopeptidase MepM/ murein hydrolase activator NlpD
MTLLLALALCSGPPAKPSVMVTPARPAQGTLVMIRVKPANGDSSVVALSAQFEGEPLHFEKDSTGTFVAYGGIPVEAHGTLSLPIAIERSGGALDSLDVKIAVTKALFGSENLSVDPRFTDKPDSALAARISHEAEAIRQAWLTTHQTPRLWHGAFQRPRPSRITGVFGTRREFNGVTQSRHLGMDFDGSVGSTIRASNAGVVTLVGDYYFSGNIVVINHGGGIATAYLHMSKVLVSAGDTVTRGQLIGLVGSTGRVTGPHLHWIAKYGTISVNPMSLLTLTTEPKAPAKATPRGRTQPRR